MNKCDRCNYLTEDKLIKIKILDLSEDVESKDDVIKYQYVCSKCFADIFFDKPKKKGKK